MTTFKSKPSSIDSCLEVSVDAPHGIFVESIGGSHYVNVCDEDAIELRDWLNARCPVAAPQQDLVGALRLCVASLDQLLPYLAKVPADIGLLNDALIAGRAALAVQGGAQ